MELKRLGGKACQKILVRTSFAPIQVALLEGAAYSVTARTSFGKIQSEVPITATGTISEQSLTGKIGDGRCEMSLSDSNGNIEITKR